LDTCEGGFVRARRARILVLAGSVIAVTCVLTPAAAAARATAPAAAAPVITSVVISGSVASPRVTIRGHHLGVKPGRLPSYHPPGHPLCPTAKPKNHLASYGYDYGTDLFISDLSASPIWSAGRYRPKLGELDCIGVIINRYTASTIVFHLGKAYPHFAGAPAHYRLAPGDRFEVGVYTTTFHGKVAFK
jgi:hypothetical protein